MHRILKTIQNGRRPCDTKFSKNHPDLKGRLLVLTLSQPSESTKKGGDNDITNHILLKPGNWL